MRKLRHVRLFESFESKSWWESEWPTKQEFLTSEEYKKIVSLGFGLNEEMSHFPEEINTGEEVNINFSPKGDPDLYPQLNYNSHSVVVLESKFDQKRADLRSVSPENWPGDHKNNKESRLYYIGNVLAKYIEKYLAKEEYYSHKEKGPKGIKEVQLFFSPDDYDGREIGLYMQQGSFGPSEKPDPYDYYDMLAHETRDQLPFDEDNWDEEFKEWFDEYVDVPVFNGVFTVKYDSSVTNIKEIERSVLEGHNVWYEIKLEDLANAFRRTKGVISVEYR